MPSSRTQPRARSLTLLEVVFASALLALTLLSLGLVTSTSNAASADARSRLVAAQAAELLAHRLEAEPPATLFAAYWSRAALETESIAGREWVVGGDAAGALASVRAEVLEPALASGRLAAPGTGSMLALRFLSEAELSALTGWAADLDHDGSSAGALPAPGAGAPAPGYAYYPFEVLVRYRDAGGERTLVLLAGSGEHPGADPQ